LGKSLKISAKLFRNKVSIPFFILKVLEVFLIFSLHIIISKSFNVESFGMFSYIFVLGSILTTIVPLGFNTSIISLIGRYKNQNNIALLSGAIKSSILITCIVSLIISFLLFIFYNLYEIKMKFSLQIISLLIPALGINHIRKKISEAYHEYYKSITYDLLFFLSMILILFFIEISFKRFLLIYIIFYYFITIISFSDLIKLHLINILRKKSKYILFKWIKYSFPMFISSFGQLLLTRIDILVIGIFLGSISVGYYSASVRMATLISFSLNVIYIINAPYIVKFFSKKDLSSLKNIIISGTLFSLLFAVPIFAILIIFDSMILDIFGNSYSNYTKPLIILSFGQLVNSFFGMAATALLYTNKGSFYSIVLLFTVFISLIGNYLVVPNYGINGAAYITAGCLIIGRIIQAFYFIYINFKKQ